VAEENSEDNMVLVIKIMVSVALRITEEIRKIFNKGE
jgi:hypothetical protein